MNIQYTLVTGRLALKRVTPVIQALFGEYHLRDLTATAPKAFFLLRPDGDRPTWDTFLSRLVDAAKANGLILDSNSAVTIDAVVSAFARHLGNTSAPAHAIAYDREPDLIALYDIAIHLNDGHDLAVLACQTSRTFDSPNPLPAGGCYWFLSRDVRLHGDSYDAIHLAAKMFHALNVDDPDELVEVIVEETTRVVDTIVYPEVRPLIALRVAQRLHKLSLEALQTEPA